MSEKICSLCNVRYSHQTCKKCNVCICEGCFYVSIERSQSISSLCCKDVRLYDARALYYFAKRIYSPENMSLIHQIIFLKRSCKNIYDLLKYDTDSYYLRKKIRLFTETRSDKIAQLLPNKRVGCIKCNYFIPHTVDKRTIVRAVCNCNNSIYTIYTSFNKHAKSLMYYEYLKVIEKYIFRISVKDVNCSICGSCYKASNFFECCNSYQCANCMYTLNKNVNTKLVFENHICGLMKRCSVCKNKLIFKKDKDISACCGRRYRFDEAIDVTRPILFLNSSRPFTYKKYVLYSLPIEDQITYVIRNFYI